MQISGLNKLTFILSQKIKNLSYNPLNNAASPLVKKSQKRLYFVAIGIKRIRLSDASFSEGFALANKDFTTILYKMKQTTRVHASLPKKLLRSRTHTF